MAKKLIQVLVPESQKRDLKTRLILEDMTMQDFIGNLVTAYLEGRIDANGNKKERCGH